MMVLSLCPPNDNPLSSRVPVSDEEATAALREFFSSISPSEVRRIYECFYYQLHHEAPPFLLNKPPQTSGGLLNGGGGEKVKTKGNGK